MFCMQVINSNSSYPDWRANHVWAHAGLLKLWFLQRTTQSACSMCHSLALFSRSLQIAQLPYPWYGIFFRGPTIHSYACYIAKSRDKLHSFVNVLGHGSKPIHLQLEQTDLLRVHKLNLQTRLIERITLVQEKLHLPCCVLVSFSASARSLPPARSPTAKANLSHDGSPYFTVL